MEKESDTGTYVHDMIVLSGHCVSHNMYVVLFYHMGLCCSHLHVAVAAFTGISLELPDGTNSCLLMSSHLVMKQTCRWHSRCHGDGISVSLLCGCWFRNTAYILHPVKGASGIEGAKQSLLWKMMQCGYQVRILLAAPVAHKACAGSAASELFVCVRMSSRKFLQIKREIILTSHSKQWAFNFFQWKSQVLPVGTKTLDKSLKKKKKESSLHPAADLCFFGDSDYLHRSLCCPDILSYKCIY